MIIFIWFVAFVILGLWTVAAWGLQALLSTDGSWVARIEPWLSRVPFADRLETWFPTWQDLARVALDAAQVALAWLGGMAPVIVWIAWGVGTLMLLLLAGLLTLVVVLMRRKPPPTAPPSAPPATA